MLGVLPFGVARTLNTRPRDAELGLEVLGVDLRDLILPAEIPRQLRDNPELQNLRMPQALNTAPGKAPPTLVLGAGQILPVRTGGAAEPDPAPEAP